MKYLLLSQHIIFFKIIWIGKNMAFRLIMVYHDTLSFIIHFYVKKSDN